MQGVDLSKSSDVCSLTRNNEKFSGTYYKTGCLFFFFFCWKPFGEARLHLGRNAATYNFTEFYYCFDTQWENILEMISCRREDICIARFCSDKFFVLLQTSIPWNLLSCLSCQSALPHTGDCTGCGEEMDELKSKHKNKQQINKWSQD